MKKILFLILLLFVSYSENLSACTVFIAGKNTTVDGSILFGKTEDDGSLSQLDYLWQIPRKQFKKGSFKTLISGLKIPQVAETYAYLVDECPQTHFSNMIINEWGVAFGSNGCRSKENIDDLKARNEILDGGIGFDLRFTLAERAKTAKEAVLIAVDLINKYGYNSSGRSLNIVDQNEAWQLQMVAGKHFVARKVQDDEVVVIANTYSIRTVDLSDTDNFICSPDLIDYAIERGWYNPKEGKKFDFALAYAPTSAHTSSSNTHRQWMLAYLLNKNFNVSLEEAEKGMMPVSVIPDRKLAVQDFTDILRNHYEGLPLDKSENHLISPHYTLQTICRYTTHRTTVVQQRSDLPAEIGTVCWRALGEPCNSIFVPWYLGINKIPEAYQRSSVINADFDQENFNDYHFNIPNWKIQQIDLASAAKAFWLLGYLADNDYQNHNQKLKNIFRPMEKKLYQQQDQIEKEALKLYQKDKDAACNFLTNYTQKWALKVYDEARKQISEFSKQ